MEGSLSLDLHHTTHLNARNHASERADPESVAKGALVRRSRGGMGWAARVAAMMVMALLAACGGESGVDDPQPAEAGPRIALAQPTVAFTATPGGGAPASQTVAITNGGTGALRALTVGTIEYAAGARAWLTARLSSATAPSTLTLTATPGGLAPGTHTATVPVASSEASNSPARLTVTLQVPSAPVIGLRPDSLSFTSSPGGPSPPVQTVAVTNAGTGALSALAIGSIAYGPGATGWLTAALDSSTAPATLRVTSSPGTLAVGTYTASLPVTAAGASNSPRPIAVSLHITTLPAVVLSPPALSFAATAGGTAPPAQTVAVTNGGMGTLDGLSVGSVTYGPGAAGWLTATLSRTTAPATLTVTPTLGSLAPGTYTATVPVTGAGVGTGAQSLAVTVTVAGVPRIGLAPPTVTFTGTAGGPAPAAQSVAVTNAGTGTLGGLTVGSISYGAGATAWLTATLSAPTAPATLTLSPTLGTVAPGTYTATVPVLAAGVGNSPQSVAVTLTVTGQPAISLAPTSVSFAGQTGGPAPSAQTVSVTNAGTGTLGGLGVGSISYGAGATGWLTATLSGGTAPATLTLTPSAGPLPAGSYTATVPVTAPGAANSPQSVPVTMTVISTVISPGAETVRLALAAALAAPQDVAAARGVVRVIDSLFAARPVDDALSDYVAGRDVALRGVSVATLRAWGPTFNEAERQVAAGSRVATLRSTPDDGVADLFYINGVNTNEGDSRTTLKTLYELLTAPPPDGRGWKVEQYGFDKLENLTAPLLGDLGESVANITAQLGLTPPTAVSQAAAARINNAIERKRRQVILVAHSQGNLIALEALRYVNRPECVGVVSIATPQTVNWPLPTWTPSRGFIAGSTGELVSAPFEDIITILPTFGRLPPNFAIVPTPLSDNLLRTAIPDARTGLRGATLGQRKDLHLIDAHYLTRGRGDPARIVTLIDEVDRAVQVSCGRVVAAPAAVTVPVGRSVPLQLSVAGPQGRVIDAVSIQPEGVARFSPLGGSGFGLLNITGLTPGTATLTARSGPLQVRVPITVTVERVLSLSASSVSFIAQEGASNPAPQVVTATWSAGGDAPRLTWPPTLPAWLTVSTQSGATETRLTLTPNVSASGGQLRAGTYTYSLEVSAEGASNSPQRVAVTLTVVGQLQMAGNCSATCPVRCTLGSFTSTVQGEAGPVTTSRAVQIPKFFWPGVAVGLIRFEGRIFGDLTVVQFDAGGYNGMFNSALVGSYLWTDGRTYMPYFLSLGSGWLPGGAFDTGVLSGGGVGPGHSPTILLGDGPGQIMEGTIENQFQFTYTSDPAGNGGTGTSEWAVVYGCQQPR